MACAPGLFSTCLARGLEARMHRERLTFGGSGRYFAVFQITKHLQEEVLLNSDGRGIHVCGILKGMGLKVLSWQYLC